MKTAEIDTIYLDLAAGINAAEVTCHDASAGITELLKAQHALDGLASMLTRVRNAAPGDAEYQTMFSELADTTTGLRLVLLQRLCASEKAA